MHYNLAVTGKTKSNPGVVLTFFSFLDYEQSLQHFIAIFSYEKKISSEISTMWLTYSKLFIKMKQGND